MTRTTALAVLATGLIAAAAATPAHAATYDLSSVSNFNSSTGTLPSYAGGVLTMVNGEYYGAYSAFTSGFAASSVGSFTADFTFTLTNVGATPQADGIAFVVQNLGTNFLGAYGGNLGLAYAGGNGAAVVFQSWLNDHATIVTDENPYGGTQPIGNFALGYNDVDTVTADVSYSGGVLSVSATNLATGATYDDSLALDLAGLAGPSGDLYFGFTSGTGGSTSLTQVDSLSLSVSPVPLPAALPMFACAVAGLGVAARRRPRSV